MKAESELVSDSVEATQRVDSNDRVICGAGKDVDVALKLGAMGILVASGIVKASDWRAKKTELAETLTG